MRKSIKNILQIATMLGALVYTGVSGRMDVELPRLAPIRYILRETGIWKDPYQNMSAKEVVEKVNTWENAQNYLMTHYSYSSSKGGYPAGYKFSEIHGARKGNCSAGTDIACMLLNRSKDFEGFYSQLDLKKGLPKIRPFLTDHAICIVKDKKTGKFGSLGINKVDCVKPVYDTIEDVENKVNARFHWTFDVKRSLGYYGEGSNGIKYTGKI